MIVHLVLGPGAYSKLARPVERQTNDMVVQCSGAMQWYSAVCGTVQCSGTMQCSGTVGECSKVERKRAVVQWKSSGTVQ